MSGFSKKVLVCAIFIFFGSVAPQSTLASNIWKEYKNPSESDTIEFENFGLFKAGTQRNLELYASRVSHNGTWTPAKLIKDHRLRAVITNDGVEHRYAIFQVLTRTEQTLSWTKYEGFLPLKALRVNETVSSDLYFCQAIYHDEHRIIGKFRNSTKNCYIDFDGKELAMGEVDNISILVDSGSLEYNSMGMSTWSSISLILLLGAAAATVYII